MQRTLYFAYGSNLDGAQMRVRCPGADEVGPALLGGFRLAFGGRSKSRGNRGVANILPANGVRVQGFVYLAGPADMTALDHWEGVASGQYERASVKVVGRDGASFEATTYVMPLTRYYPSAPDGDYLALIRRAYAERGFDRGVLDAALREVEPRG